MKSNFDCESNWRLMQLQTLQFHQDPSYQWFPLESCLGWSPKALSKAYCFIAAVTWYVCSSSYHFAQAHQDLFEYRWSPLEAVQWDITFTTVSLYTWNATLETLGRAATFPLQARAAIFGCDEARSHKTPVSPQCWSDQKSSASKSHLLSQRWQTLHFA